MSHPSFHFKYNLDNTRIIICYGKYNVGTFVPLPNVKYLEIYSDNNNDIFFDVLTQDGEIKQDYLHISRKLKKLMSHYIKQENETHELINIYNKISQIC